MSTTSLKNAWIYTLALSVVGLSSGCGDPQVAEKPLMLRMAHVYEVNSPTHAYGTKFLSERICSKTSELDVTVYPASQLGSESELLEQLVAGLAAPHPDQLVGRVESVVDAAVHAHAACRAV